MHKHIILFFSALLFLLACKQGSDSKGVINVAEMTRLLVDIHIVDGSLAQQPNADSLYKYGTGRYLYLFKQYHTDSAQFKRSVRYYTSNPDVLIKMYDDVNKMLQFKADSLNKLITAETVKANKRQTDALKKSQKKQQDSIAKAKSQPKPLIQEKINFKNALPRK